MMVLKTDSELSCLCKLSNFSCCLASGELTIGNGGGESNMELQRKSFDRGHGGKNQTI